MSHPQAQELTQCKIIKPSVIPTKKMFNIATASKYPFSEGKRVRFFWQGVENPKRTRECAGFAVCHPAVFTLQAFPYRACFTAK
jgi:hypothetical protein